MGAGAEGVAEEDLTEADTAAVAEVDAVPEAADDDGPGERVAWAPPFSGEGAADRDETDPDGVSMAESSVADTVRLGAFPELKAPPATAITAAAPTPNAAVPTITHWGLRRAGDRRPRPATRCSEVRTDMPSRAGPSPTGPSKSRRSSWATVPAD
ncbi:hypothetical protein OG758_41540 [Streptomyces sp. NBC_01474]|uniref:hypothetical protein n=1 Tax=Streptomyces sp. NBC_01474 TaxID=2903880 RepID=UPI002DD888EA|nr:hypothetical protein [Streptomyces sp. NBC_01474]WSE01944.1 hypothetical protein OG758_41540 [Streptomyces sp. NBC_01474]